MTNDFEKKTVEFNLWYDKKIQYHNEAVLFFCKLISTAQFVESVSGRVKNSDECISKFTRKYFPALQKDETDYFISNYISDLIGIRAICFYTEEIKLIRKSLRKYFIEKEISDKIGRLEKTEDKFGYKSLHLQLELKRNIKGITDASKFKNLQFELQIRTVIQDAWSVLDHKIKYKKSIPQNLKRRINRLSALFEIAEDEFLSVKSDIEKEERKINTRLRKGGNVEKNKALDVFRFLFIGLKHFPGYNFIEYKVDGFVQEILALQNNFTEGNLEEALVSNLKFADKIENKYKQKLNPYTKIKYCLYGLDNEVFNSVLSDHQKEIYKSTIKTN